MTEKIYFIVILDNCNFLSPASADWHWDQFSVVYPFICQSVFQYITPECLAQAENVNVPSNTLVLPRLFFNLPKLNKSVYLSSPIKLLNLKTYFHCNWVDFSNSQMK